MADETRVDTFEAFFLAEFPRLVSMLTAWSGSRSTAEDLAQDALLQAQRSWSSVSTLDKPGAWVRRVALNRSSNERRRRRRERNATARLRTVDAWSTPLLDDDLWRLVRALPDHQRDATVLRYVDDLPLAEIAAIIGCSEGTVKTHLQRARHTLAEHLSNDRRSRHDP